MTDFQTWWEAYPKGDGFKYKGRNFKRTRALRLDEKKCEKKFLEILKKGRTLEQMVEALEKEKKSRMDQSISTNLNQLHYMKNSYAYLNSGAYDAWIEDDEEYDFEEKKEKLIDPKSY